jgi:phage terminase large subunit-like protein
LDDTAFAFIARVDEGDDPFEDESCWQKALPALNITFPVENVRTRVQTAKFLLSEALATKRLYFGIPVGSSGFWISEEAWRSAQGDVDLAKVRGAKCWASLDLSQKNDLTALTLVWDLNGHLYARSWYWTTKSGLADRERDDKVPYGQWVSQGHMEAVAGAVIDKEFVAAKLQELHAQFGIDFLAFDSAGMADFIAACERIDFPVWKYEGVGKPEGQGLKLVSHGQGTRVVFEDKALCMPRSVERLEDAILNSRITIQSNPVTTMCASNALVVADAMNNRAFDKKRSRGRIDGMVTLAMAVGASEMVPVDNGPSFWEVVS